MPGKPGSPEDRFWRYVTKQPDGCWIWTGARTDRGYGQLFVGGRMVYAHRFAWELLVGPIPAGQKLGQWSCLPEPDRVCVNPAHLRLATSKQSCERRPRLRNNTSGATGVCFDPRSGKWRAQVRHYRRAVFIGAFVSPEDAATAARDVRSALFTHNLFDRDGIPVIGDGLVSAADGCKAGLPGQVSQDCGQPTGRSSVLCDDHFDAIIDKALAGASPKSADRDLVASA